MERHTISRTVQRTYNGATCIAILTTNINLHERTAQAPSLVCTINPYRTAVPYVGTNHSNSK